MSENSNNLLDSMSRLHEKFGKLTKISEQAQETAKESLKATRANADRLTRLENKVDVLKNNVNSLNDAQQTSRRELARFGLTDDVKDEIVYFWENLRKWRGRKKVMIDGAIRAGAAVVGTAVVIGLLMWVGIPMFWT